MSGSKPAFVVKIVAESGDSAELIKKIKSELDHAAGSAHKLGHELKHVHNESVWHKLHEHLTESTKQFGELQEHVKGLHESMVELVPAMGVFAAAGSLVGMFETVEHVSEAYGELAHAAESLGVSAQELNIWNTVAKLTDTSAESMEKSMARLNRTLGDAGAGKNKDAAALFKQLHLNPKGFHDAADALPALANAFQHTHDATMRARMAFALFGKAGTEMLPLLMRGAAGVRELQEESGKLAFNFEGYGEGLEHYNEAMKKLGIATGAFTNELGAKLAPAFEPIIDDLQEWVTANRDWLTTDITDEVRQLAHWVDAIDWHKVGEEMHEWAGSAEELVQHLGGAKVLIEVLAGLWFTSKVFSAGKWVAEVAKIGSEISGLAVKLVSELVPAWGKVETAAHAAGAEELAAGGAGGAGVGGGTNLVVKGIAAGAATASVLAGAGLAVETVARGSTLAAGKSRGETDDQAAGDYIAGESGVNLPDRAGGSGVSSYGDIGDWFSKHVWGGGDQDSVTPLGSVNLKPPGAAGGAPLSGQANVTVWLPNAPPGTTAQASGGGVLAQPTVNLGQAFGDHYGND